MERWSISEFSTMRWCFEDDVQGYAHHGFQNIGLWHQKVQDGESEDREDRLFHHHLGVSSYSWIGGFTGSEGVSHVDAVRQAREEIRIASRLGAATVIVHPGSSRGHTNKHARRLLTLALAELIPCAADYGVRLALEPMDRRFASDWTIFDGFFPTLEFVQQYAPFELGLVLDLFHVGLEETVRQAVPDFVDRVTLVQVADRRRPDRSGNKFPKEQCRLLPGCGEVSVDDWIRQLEFHGYTGHYECELFGPEVQAHGYRVLLERLSQWTRRLSPISSRQFHS